MTRRAREGADTRHAPRRDRLRAETPEVAACLMMAAVAGMIFNTGTSIPVIATQTFGLGKVGLGLLTACFGLGAIPGGLAAAYSRNTRLATPRALLCLGSGLAVIAFACAPARAAAFPLMVLVGFLSIWMIALANTLVQLAAEREPPRARHGALDDGAPRPHARDGADHGRHDAVRRAARAGYGIAGVLLCAAALAGWRPLAE